MFIPGIEIAVRWFPRDLLPKASGLRWMQQWGADWLMEYPEAAAMDFVLTNASGVHAVPISEHISARLRRAGPRVRAWTSSRPNHCRRTHPLWDMEGICNETCQVSKNLTGLFG